MRSTTWRPRALCPPASSSPCSPASSRRLGVTRVLDAIRIVDRHIRFYQASSSRNVRQGAGGRRRRESTPFYPRSPYGVAKAVRPLDHGQLSRKLRPLRVFRHPVQPRIAAARAGIRDAQDHASASRASSSGWPTELRLGNLEVAPRLGLRARLCARDVVDAPAGPPRRLRRGNGRDAHGARVLPGRLRLPGPGLGEVTSSWIRSSIARRRWTCLSATRARRARILGWEPSVTFRDLVHIMVDADLAMLQTQGDHTPRI